MPMMMVMTNEQLGPQVIKPNNFGILVGNDDEDDDNVIIT